MKDHVIIYGPMGSGKTTIAKAMALQYSLEQSEFVEASTRERLIGKVLPKLIVFEGCKDEEEIADIAQSLDNNTSCNLVFTTQKDIDVNHGRLRRFLILKTNYKG